MKPGEITYVQPGPPKKELRITASEIELRRILYGLDQNRMISALGLLEEIKRQMYLDGAEDMVQSMKGTGWQVDRTKVKP